MVTSQAPYAANVTAAARVCRRGSSATPAISERGNHQPNTTTAAREHRPSKLQRAGGQEHHDRQHDQRDVGPSVPVVWLLQSEPVRPRPFEYGRGQPDHHGHPDPAPHHDEGESEERTRRLRNESAEPVQGEQRGGDGDDCGARGG